MENPVALLTLKILFLSCIAVGGFIATVPELNRFAVQVQGWMSDGTFATLFALSQASPGPNLIIATLVGWEVAGFAGAVLATAATCLPTLVIAYQAMRLRAHHGRARWFLLVERAILPIAVGLILATAILLTASASGAAPPKLALTALTAVFLLATRRSPLVPLAIAAVLGGAGWV
ncbi:chromate transporter (plasmid) [Paracoccus versutus]|uniref:Chromate transporter n=1 Tax=Paracoccus versutus TaxID=34007 RepID=A0AAQ0HHC1_PARVE|nr:MULTISPECIES: chromate transporter [Paracoccus]SFY36866.1 chromate transporter [Paracoccus pantotrophus]KGJ11067.1 chromate transporter [Paracoccus versutus]RDD72056.1 chromate transporter [Paracoccus versutus]REG45789.1 chromate transporter [Paracoccus versutus]WEJ80687.1 chromate transporter [Paracoccus versutus]